MNYQTVGYKIPIFKDRELIHIFLIALLLTACAPSAPTPQPPTPLLAEQTDTAHAPVVIRMEERTETQNGQLLLYKDIYFTDPEGDAITLVNKLVSTDPTGIPATFADDPITVPVDEQKNTGLITISIGCREALRPFSYTTEDRIRDAAGNLSEPIAVIFACPANPPDSLPFVIVALVIGTGLLVGLWLYLRKHPAEQTQSMFSILLLLCTLFPIYFMGSVFHEGGHALANLILRGTVKTIYIHPFAFSGFAMPFTDNAWFHAMGYILNLLVCFVLFCLLWERRSATTLPFIMLFPFETFSSGILILLLNGDIANILRLTGLPAILFVMLGLVLFCLGLLLLLALFPLLGLNSTDKKSLLIVPTAFYIHGAISLVIAHVFVPDSYIENQHLLGAEILQSANTLVYVLPIIGAILAVFYLTLFRKFQPKLPTWLRTELVNLTWKDVRIPAVLAAISITLGTIIITH